MCRMVCSFTGVPSGSWHCSTSVALDLSAFDEFDFDGVAFDGVPCVDFGVVVAICY